VIRVKSVLSVLLTSVDRILDMLEREDRTMLRLKFLCNRGLRSYIRLSALVLVMLLTFIAASLSYSLIGIKWVSDDIPVKYSKSGVAFSWHSAIDNAASAWSAVETDKFSYQAWTGFDPKVQFVEIAGTSKYAETQLAYDEPARRILSATIRIYGGWNWWTDPWTTSTPPILRPHLYTTALHELGHTLGLAHTFTDTSIAVMAESRHSTGLHTRRDLATDDQLGLMAIYVSGQGCKPVVIDKLMPGAGLANWQYASRLAYSAGLIEEDFEQIFASQGKLIINAINSDPSIQAQADRLAENLARDIHVSLSQGKGYDAPLTASRIQEIDTFLETLSSQMVLDQKLQDFRNLLRGSEGRSFWSVLSEVAHQRIITVPALRQNVPNPFNPNTTIDFELPDATYVRLQVYNLTGQLIRTLMSETAFRGRHRIVWDGKDDLGRAVASGIYIYRLEIPSRSFVDQKKMALLR